MTSNSVWIDDSLIAALLLVFQSQFDQPQGLAALRPAALPSGAELCRAAQSCAFSAGT